MCGVLCCESCDSCDKRNVNECCVVLGDGCVVEICAV